MLGQDAIYSKLRSVAFAQPSVVLGEWSQLASHSPHNRYMSVSTQGVPGKTVLPERITLSVPDVAAQVPDKLKARKRWQPGTPVLYPAYCRLESRYCTASSGTGRYQRTRSAHGQRAASWKSSA